MTRNTLNASDQSCEKNTLRGKQQAQSDLPSFTFWISTLVGMIALIFLGRQRIWGTESFNVAALTNQSSSYRIQFPGLTPLVVSSALAYQIHSPTLGLLCSMPLWLAAHVNAQALAPVIDFNTPLTRSQGLILNGKSNTADTTYNTGYSVAIAGDVNGDGFNDFLIGSHQLTFSTYGAGVVYLIYGSTYLPASLNLASLIQLQGLVLYGTNTDNAGYSVATAGDVNGDKLIDFLIGAPYAYGLGLSYGRSAGAAYLVYGSTNFSAKLNLFSLTKAQGVTLYSGIADNQAGLAIASAGDVNSDGKSDFFISSGSSTYLVYGSNDLPATLTLANLTTAQGFVIQGVGGKNALAGP